MAANFYDNKKKIDIKLLKDNFGLKIYKVDGRMLQRVIASLRSKFVKEIPNFYHLLIPFITEYNDANPNSLSIVQVDSKKLFLSDNS